MTLIRFYQMPTWQLLLWYVDRTKRSIDLTSQLSSLEIISPTFDVIPWQKHLATARQMIAARGGAHTMHRKDEVSYFLSVSASNVAIRISA